MHISLRGSWSAGPTPASALLFYHSHAPTRLFQSRIMAEAAAGGRLSNRANIYRRISGTQCSRLQLWSHQCAGLTVSSVSIVLKYKIMWLNISADVCVLRVTLIGVAWWSEQQKPRRVFFRYNWSHQVKWVFWYETFFQEDNWLCHISSLSVFMWLDRTRCGEGHTYLCSSGTWDFYSGFIVFI